MLRLKMATVLALPYQCFKSQAAVRNSVNPAMFRAFVCMMALAYPSQVCWLFAREGQQCKLGPADRRTIAQDVRYSGKLKRQLLSGQVLPSHAAALLESDPAHKWHGAFSHLDGQVVGAAVFRTNARFDVLSCLSSAQRCVREYWSLTKYAENPLIILDVLAAVKFARPVTVRSAHVVCAPTSLFFECTPFSAEELLKQSVVSGDLVMNILFDWRSKFCGIGDSQPMQTSEELLSALKKLRTCFCMPAPHALLIAGGVWSSYSFPVAQGRSAGGMGLRLAADLYRPVAGQLVQGVQGQNKIAEGLDSLLQPDTLQAIADFIRKAAQEVPHLACEAATHVALLQNTVDSLVQDAQATSRRAFSLETLVHSLIISGYLHNSADMRDLLRSALRVCIRVPELLEHFDSLHCKPRRVPGASTLYRHRLTVHIAFCRWVSNVNNPIVLDESGFCRWGTLDSSPQGSWDWLLAGATLARMAVVESCYEDANQLIVLGKQQDSKFTADEQTAVAHRLARHLSIVQGTPTAVGAGRSGLIHKVHALAHSVRLSAANWKQTCRLLNQTVTWTADMGVESGLHTFRGNVCAMFGDWVWGEIDESLVFASEASETPQAAAAGLPVQEQEPAGQFDFACVGRDPENVRPDLSEAMKSYNLNFTESIYIPGPLHIMHNMTEGLSRAMLWWPEFLSRLTNLCRLLGRKWNRQRLFATCFCDPPWNAFVDLYASFNGQVYQGRWGSVLHAVKELLPLEISLRGAWSKAKFCLNGQPPREGRDGSAGKSLNVDLVDDACQSQQFWAYMFMVKQLGDTIEHVMNWCEACPCHGHDESLQGKAKHSKKGLFARIGLHSCPMASRRAPECAAGAILEVIRQGLQSMERGLVLHSSFLACDEGARQVVLSDSSHGKRYCMLVANIKFSHWEQLPWVLMGVAHHDADKARQCASRALRLYAATGSQVAQHPVSKQLCCPGTRGHAELSAFISGEPLCNLAFLRRFAAKYKFVSVCERWIESRHALLGRHLRKATHVSAQHVAFSGCQHVLRELLLHKPHELNQLVQLCDFTRSPGSALQAVNLHYHPSVRRIMLEDRSQLARKYRPWVVELLYHVDRKTLFQNLPANGGYVGDDGSNGPDSQGPAALKDVATPSVPAAVEGSSSMRSPSGSPGPPGPAGGASSSTDSQGGILHDALWCKYAVEHMRHVLEEKQQPDCQFVWSLGPRLQTGLQHALTDLAQRVNPLPDDSSRALPALEQFEFLEPHASMSMEARQDRDPLASGHGVLLFTVTSKNPSNIKVPRYAPQVTEKDCLAIAPVQLRHVDMQKQQLFLKLDQEQTPVLLHPAALSVDDFSTLRLWKGSGTLQYDFGLQGGCEFTDLMQRVIREIVKASRFHPKKIYRLPRHLDPDCEKAGALKELESRGLVHQEARDAWTEWTLTDMGRQHLQTSEIFTVSEMFCKGRQLP